MANAHHVSPTSAWSSSAGQENYQRCYLLLRLSMMAESQFQVCFYSYTSFFLIFSRFPWHFALCVVSWGSKKTFFFEVTKMILGQTDTVLENHSKKSHASKIMYQARCSPIIREVAWSCIESFRIFKLQNFDVRLLGKFFTDFFFSSQKCLKIQYLDKSSTIPFAVCRLKENEILGLYYAQSSCWKLLPHPHWILIFKANQNQDFWCQKPLLRGF